MSTNDVNSLIEIYINHGHGSLAGIDGVGGVHSIGDIGDIEDIEGCSAIGFQDCEHQKYT